MAPVVQGRGPGRGPRGRRHGEWRRGARRLDPRQLSTTGTGPGPAGRLPAPQEREGATVSEQILRKIRGLPVRTDPRGAPLRFDGLRHQPLAKAVPVYGEQFSAHHLERDASAP